MKALRPTIVLISLLLAAGAALLSGPPAHAQTTSTTVTRIEAHLASSPDAQQANSSSITVTQTSISLLYLADGAGKGATALAVPLYAIPGTGNRVKLCGIGAVSAGASAQIYMGTAVSYLLYSSKTGWSATVFAGWKGVNLTNGRLPSGAGNAVLGLGITIPIRSL